MAQWDFGVVAFQIADDFVPGVARLAGLGHVKRISLLKALEVPCCYYSREAGVLSSRIDIGAMAPFYAFLPVGNADEFKRQPLHIPARGRRQRKARPAIGRNSLFLLRRYV
jgi:hypothetical protein